MYIHYVFPIKVHITEQLLFSASSCRISCMQQSVPSCSSVRILLCPCSVCMLLCPCSVCMLLCPCSTACMMAAVSVCLAEVCMKYSLHCSSYETCKQGIITLSIPETNTGQRVHSHFKYLCN